MNNKLTILYVDEYPLRKMGRLAGLCWKAPVDDPVKNERRGIECIKAGHWRVLEFVDVIMEISGISARLGRELYTHIGGAPTRLQESTRYVDESGFKYYEPAKCADNPEYAKAMENIQKSYGTLLSAGVPREDAANILPLGMETRIVWKVNLRTLVNFMNKRLCTRALKEIRDFTGLLRKTLGELDSDWAFIARTLFVPSCEVYKWRNPALCFCQETKCCGRHPKVEDIVVSGPGSETSGEG